MNAITLPAPATLPATVDTVVEGTKVRYSEADAWQKLCARSPNGKPGRLARKSHHEWVARICGDVATVVEIRASGAGFTCPWQAIVEWSNGETSVLVLDGRAEVVS